MKPGDLGGQLVEPSERSQHLGNFNNLRLRLPGNLYKYIFIAHSWQVRIAVNLLVTKHTTHTTL